MEFSVDATVGVLKVLEPWQDGFSGLFPFQRDNRLYIVGRKSVAVISPGIPCSYYADHRDNTLNEYISEPAERKPVKHIEGDGAEYFALILREPSGRGNSLGELLKMRDDAFDKKLDDGQMRMVNHGESYHSHKYGYAADGVDVSVMDSRVMNREEYFDLMRMRELKARRELDKGGTSLLPGVSIITPDALISFPFSLPFRQENLERHYDDHSPIVEVDMTSFNKDVDIKKEFPYSFNIALLGRNFRFSSPDELQERDVPRNERHDFVNTMGLLERLRGTYTPAVKSIIDEANAMHNSKHAEEIERWKSYTS